VKKRRKTSVRIAGTLGEVRTKQAPTTYKSRALSLDQHSQCYLVSRYGMHVALLPRLQSPSYHNTSGQVFILQVSLRTCSVLNYTSIPR
jgi:hypothetical protein